MFVVKCTHCGREQEWKTGIDLLTAQIQFAGNLCVCDCGNLIKGDGSVMIEGVVEE